MKLNGACHVRLKVLKNNMLRMMEDIGGNCIVRNIIAFTPSKDDEMDAFGMKYSLVREPVERRTKWIYRDIKGIVLEGVAVYYRQKRRAFVKRQ